MTDIIVQEYHCRLPAVTDMIVQEYQDRHPVFYQRNFIAEYNEEKAGYLSIRLRSDPKDRYIRIS